MPFSDKSFLLFPRLMAEQTFRWCGEVEEPTSIKVKDFIFCKVMYFPTPTINSDALPAKIGIYLR